MFIVHFYYTFATKIIQIHHEKVYSNGYRQLAVDGWLQ